MTSYSQNWASWKDREARKAAARHEIELAQMRDLLSRATVAPSNIVAQALVGLAAQHLAAALGDSIMSYSASDFMDLLRDDQENGGVGP